VDKSIPKDKVRDSGLPVVYEIILELGGRTGRSILTLNK
jgi:hypothetical protein